MEELFGPNAVAYYPWPAWAWWLTLVSLIVSVVALWAGAFGKLLLSAVLSDRWVPRVTFGVVGLVLFGVSIWALFTWPRHTASRDTVELLLIPIMLGSLVTAGWRALANDEYHDMPSYVGTIIPLGLAALSGVSLAHDGLRRVASQIPMPTALLGVIIVGVIIAAIVKALSDR